MDIWRTRRLGAVGRVVAAMLVASLTLAASAAAQAQQDGFSDVESGSHKPTIDVLNEMGLFEGTECGEEEFCPGDSAKRWTVAVWLVRALDDAEPPETEESRFADVDDDEWWMPHVERLAELGVTAGCKTGPLRFCPDGTVTRAQMATFLVRAFDLKPADPAGFVDIAGSSHETNINALAAARITAGCGEQPLKYCPNRPVTRAQMSTFLAQALGLVEIPCPAPDHRSDQATDGLDLAPNRPIHIHDACNRQIIVDSGLVDDAVQPVAVFYDSNDFFQVAITGNGETVTTPRTIASFMEDLDKALDAHAGAVNADPQQAAVTRPTISWSNYDPEDESVSAWFQLAIAR